jgi:hypothetical protein
VQRWRLSEPLFLPYSGLQRAAAAPQAEQHGKQEQQQGQQHQEQRREEPSDDWRAGAALAAARAAPQGGNAWWRDAYLALPCAGPRRQRLLEGALAALDEGMGAGLVQVGGAGAGWV